MILFLFVVLQRSQVKTKNVAKQEFVESVLCHGNTQ